MTASFIGRETEIAEITALLADPHCRLLTLTGLGGMGKTRLALTIAHHVQARFPDGVFFVPLQPLQSPDQILSTVIAALELQADQKPHEQLLAWLRNKHLLLVLDNYEHLLEGVDLLNDMLAAAPNIKLLVTSRDALRLQAEWLRQLHGLDYPHAVQLFIERTRQQRGELNIEVEYPNIVHICQLVEGMPLALELAAGWVKSLSYAEMLTELEKGLTLLKSRTHDMPERHSSMEVVFEYSWQLLTDQEREGLSRISVFCGGCTRDAAEWVTGATLPVLASLVEKSLLRHDAMSGRYDLHELLRQYASKKLDQTPEIRENILDRHCDYFTTLLHQQEATIHLSHQAELLKELDNVRAAWRRAVQQRNQVALQRAAPSLHWLYHFQNWYDEGAAMFFLAEEALHEMPMTDDGRFLLGMVQLTRYLYRRRQTEPRKQPQVDLDAALALWDGLEERREMVLPLVHATIELLSNLGDPRQIIATARKNLALSKRYDDLAGAAISLTTLASVYYTAFGDFPTAQQLLEEALGIDRQIGFALNAQWSEGVLGNIASIQGRYSAASVHFEACVAHHHVGGVSKNLDSKLIALGKNALELADDVRADNHITEGMTVASRRQRYERIAEGQAGLGILAAFRGDLTAATAHYDDARTYLQSAGLSALATSELSESLGFLALSLGHYDHVLVHYEAILARYRDTGYRVPLMCAHCRVGQALIGLADETRAKPYLFDALREAGDMGASQVLLEALLGIAQLSSVPPTLAVELLTLICEHPASNRYSRTQAKRLLTMTEESLNIEDFMAALERGPTLTLEEAAALVEPFAADFENDRLKVNQQLVDPLSPRELEVLALVADGLTNREIADQLYIGVSTVKKHINHIYDKLDVKNRTGAVARARDLKLLN